MKYLSQFQRFDWDRFAEGKVFLTTGQRPWLSRDTGATLGTVIEVVVHQDKTVYARKDGDTSTNQYEKIGFKVPKAVTIPAETQVRPVDAVATIWGDFRNNLSVKASDVEVVQRPVPARVV